MGDPTICEAGRPVAARGMGFLAGDAVERLEVEDLAPAGSARASGGRVATAGSGLGGVAGKAVAAGARDDRMGSRGISIGKVVEVASGLVPPGAI
jgi:hypothetical protein